MLVKASPFVIGLNIDLSFYVGQNNTRSILKAQNISADKLYQQ